MIRKTNVPSEAGGGRENAFVIIGILFIAAIFVTPVFAIGSDFNMQGVNANDNCADISLLNEIEDDFFVYGVDESGNATALRCKEGVELGGNLVLPDYADEERTIPVVAIESMAFSASFGTPMVNTVTIGANCKTIGGGAFDFQTQLSSIDLGSVTEIGSMAFSHCENLKNITLPDSLEVLGPGLFGNTLIESIRIPVNVRSIDNTFSGSKINSITIDPNNQYFTVDDETIIYDKNKTTLVECLTCVEGVVELPSTVTKICNSAFAGCINVTGCVNTDGVTEIGNGAFWNSGIESAIFKNVETVGEYNVFNGCSNLVEVDMPKLTTPSYQMFQGCVKLETVSIPKVESILDNMFSGCTSLKSIDMSSATSIGGSAFYGCEKLSSLVIPACTESIGSRAFDAEYQHEITFEGETAIEQWSWCNNLDDRNDVIYNPETEKSRPGIYEIKNCKPEKIGGPCGQDGDNVWYRTEIIEEKRNVKIYGEGKMKDYSGSESPIYGYDIANLTIESGVKYIGSCAIKVNGSKPVVINSSNGIKFNENAFSGAERGKLSDGEIGIYGPVYNSERKVFEYTYLRQGHDAEIEIIGIGHIKFGDTKVEKITIHNVTGYEINVDDSVTFYSEIIEGGTRIELCTLEAVGDSPYEFHVWKPEGDISKEDVTISAVFTTTLKIDKGDHGKIEPEGEIAEGKIVKVSNYYMGKDGKLKVIRWNGTQSTTVMLGPVADKGYTFSKWVKGLGEDFISVSATWVENKIIIEFYGNGGTGETEPQTILYTDTSKLLKENPFFKEKHTFGGWNTSPDGTGTPYENRQDVSDMITSPNEKLTLYAQWIPNKYMATVDLDGGTVESMSPGWTLDDGVYKKDFAYGTKASVITDDFGTPTKEGHSLEWDKKDDTLDEPGMVITAIWTPNTYEVMFDANGGSEVKKTIVVTYGSEYPTLPDTTREKYDFIGWFTETEGGIEIEEGCVCEIAEDHTLHAVWTLKEEKPEVDPEVSKGNSLTMKISYPHGGVKGVYVYPKNELPKQLDSGKYTVSADGKEITLTADFISKLGVGVYSFDVYFNDDKCAVLAEFEVKDSPGPAPEPTPAPTYYEVSYDIVGGSEPGPGTASYEKGSEMYVASYIGYKDGYTFGGWSCNGKTYHAGDEFTVNGDMKFTAIWNASPGPEPTPSDDNNTGLIIGIVVAVIAAIAVIGGAVYFVRKK